MSNDNQQRTPAVRNILSEFKTRLLGRPIDGAKKEPTFSFTMNEKNDVVIKAYSNIDNDRNNGLVSGRGDITVPFMITTLVRAAVATKGPFKRTIKHEDHAFIRGQRSERPMWQFDLDVVRDAGDNDVRLVMRSYNRSDMEFYFRPSGYHAMVAPNGELMTNAQLNDAYAIGWCEMVENLTVGLLKDYQVRLYTETDQRTVEGRPPSLVFGSIANNPRATVFTNIESDQHINKGMIAGKIDVPSFYAYLQLLEEATTAAPGWRVGMKNYGHAKGEPGGRRGEKIHETTMVVGKTDDGVIYMAVLDQDRSRPSLQFALRPHRRYQMLDEAGAPMTDARVSALMAIVYRKVLERTTAKHLNDHYQAPDMSQWTGGGQRQGGGNQWGGQRQGNTQYGNQQRQQQNNQSGNTQWGQRQDSGQSHSGGNPNAQPSEPQVLSREAQPVAFDTQIPF